jgi:hypothetical protein
VSGAEDINGDGLADFIVGAPLASPNGSYSGRAYVVFGKADTEPISLADVASGSGGFILDGDAAGDYSGDSVSRAGDVNGDGVPDIMVAAPGADPNGVSESGRTYVVFGKADTDAIALADVASGVGGFALDGEGEDDISGSAISGLGDVNGDGLADLLVGARWADPNGIPAAGRTYVVFGKTDTSAISPGDLEQGIGGFVLDGEAAGDDSGRSVSGMGDISGDGIPDVVVGAPFADPGDLDSAGRAYVVFGKADTDAIALADVASGVGGFALDGEAEGDRAGQAVSAVGDVNGDGHADVAVGAPWADPGGRVASGRTYVVYGKADTEVVSPEDLVRGVGGFVLDGEAGVDHSGHSVSAAGDVNGDGVTDLLVGAPWADADGIHWSGRTYVVFGGDFSCIEH